MINSNWLQHAKTYMYYIFSVKLCHWDEFELYINTTLPL